MSASASDARVVDIGMPRLSDSMEEATILTWLKRPGDAVARVARIEKTLAVVERNARTSASGRARIELDF